MIASGLLAVGAVGGMARSVLPDMWMVPAHLLCGITLLTAVRAGRLSDTMRLGFAWASGVVQALALLWALPVVTLVLLGPAGWVGRVWSGAPSDARAAVTAEAPWPADSAAVPVALVAVAAVLALAIRREQWRARARLGALGLLWATALILPAVFETPYAAGMSVLGVMTAAALYVRRTTAPVARLTALVLALVTSVSLALTALASQTATLVVLSVLVALFAAASSQAGLAPVTAPAALVYAAALTSATGAAMDWSPARTALLVLAAPVAAALLAARLGASRATVPVEVAGAATGLLAVGLAVTEPSLLALVLALCGVIAAGTALRPEPPSRRLRGHGPVRAGRLGTPGGLGHRHARGVHAPGDRSRAARRRAAPAPRPAGLVLDGVRPRTRRHAPAEPASRPGPIRTGHGRCCWARRHCWSPCWAPGTTSRRRWCSAARSWPWSRCTNSPRTSCR